MEKIVNALGDTCPIPVIKTKKAIADLNNQGSIKVLVDNEISVQNLEKMATQMGFKSNAQKVNTKEYHVSIVLSQSEQESDSSVQIPSEKTTNDVIVLASDKMGEGSNELGAVLIKGFVYALTELEVPPKTILLYNSGAKLSIAGADTLADLKTLEEAGTEILTCGTCLNYYGISDELAVGSVTNMYVIAEKLSGADKIIKP